MEGEVGLKKVLAELIGSCQQWTEYHIYQSSEAEDLKSTEQAWKPKICNLRSVCKEWITEKIQS